MKPIIPPVLAKASQMVKFFLSVVSTYSSRVNANAHLNGKINPLLLVVIVSDYLVVKNELYFTSKPLNSQESLLIA